MLVDTAWVLCFFSKIMKNKISTLHLTLLKNRTIMEKVDNG